MKFPKRSAGSGYQDLLGCIGRIVGQLETICRDSNQSGNPSLPDLRKALARARALEKLTRGLHGQGVSYETLIALATLVLEVLMAIWYILNCNQPQGKVRENWVHHKTAPYSRRNIARLFGRGNRNYTSLSLRH
jgi:hypothetical protein